MDQEFRVPYWARQPVPIRFRPDQRFRAGIASSNCWLRTLVPPEFACARKD